MADTYRIEQLRGVVQTRIAELNSYKYMEAALLEVEQAGNKVAEAEKYLKDLQARIHAAQAALADVEEAGRRTREELEARHARRLESMKADTETAHGVLLSKQKQLDEWSTTLRAVEATHEQTVKEYRGRVDEARVELAKVQAQVAAANAQMDDLAGLIGKR